MVEEAGEGVHYGDQAQAGEEWRSGGRVLVTGWGGGVEGVFVLAAGEDERAEATGQVPVAVVVAEARPAHHHAVDLDPGQQGPAVRDAARAPEQHGLVVLLVAGRLLPLAQVVAARPAEAVAGEALVVAGQQWGRFGGEVRLAFELFLAGEGEFGFSDQVEQGYVVDDDLHEGAGPLPGIGPELDLVRLVHEVFLPLGTVPHRTEKEPGAGCARLSHERSVREILRRRQDLLDQIWRLRALRRRSFARLTSRRARCTRLTRKMRRCSAASRWRVCIRSFTRS